MSEEVSIWRVEIMPGNVYDLIIAEHVRVGEGGALILTNGDIFSGELVAAYSPGRWAYVDQFDGEIETSDDE